MRLGALCLWGAHTHPVLANMPPKPSSMVPCVAAVTCLVGERQQGRTGVRAQCQQRFHDHVAAQATHRPPPPRLRRRHPCIGVTCVTTLPRLQRRAAAQQQGVAAPLLASRARCSSAAESCSQRRGGVMAQPRVVACPPMCSPRRGSPLPAPLPRLCSPAERGVHGIRPHRWRRATGLVCGPVQVKRACGARRAVLLFR